MALRNLEEQVLYLTNELIKIKQSLGTALPDPIEGPEGPEGPEGQRGVQGEQGFGIVGFGTQFPSSGRNGDWFLLKKSTMTGIDYVMCKCISQHWVEQFSIRGPAGPIANANEVVANPIEAATGGDLDKIEIDGVVYSLIETMTGKFVKIMDAPESTTLNDDEINTIINGAFINGSFLGYKNPILLPAGDNGTVYKGIIFSGYADAGAFSMQTYYINKSTKVIAESGDDRIITLGGIYSINGKFIPDFPSSPTFRRKLVYKSDNNLEWRDDKLYRHNIRLEFTGDNFVYFTVYSTDGAPITDISEVLELKYQAIGSICMYSDNYDNMVGVITSFNNGDLGIDIGGGVSHFDYNDDLIAVSDDNSEVY